MTDDFLSDEDKALFRHHMRSVKPLHEKTKREKTSTSPTYEKKTTACKSHSVPKEEYFLSDFIRDTVESDTVLSFSNSSIPSQRFRSLRNGEIPWEAKLDLHGLKTETARQALYDFIQNQSRNNKRCLLIIHGKGGHQGAPPVIKNLINRWLPQFSQVLAFHSALPKDGGLGAVYVLLKRNREKDEQGNY
ncbi:Smr/MutS family endonuclease [Legionella sp. PATHC032]|uniref:Smr/MutS family protein n=1 Tax=Legionella sp. PATHC032 TaxID=2992039 RepID=UPI001B2C3BAF|nr:Smr/MutS family protein [Legionella sp. PATHC032]MCW8422255.1 Smr/MutS family endonuclease [Legionella sp. PATHC032]HAZ7572726.1 DNA mismatch repair protein MutS [Legionella pneumophila]HBA1634899.1 DNA mismatch repair protein MutS [Legionella pneumophila]